MIAGRFTVVAVLLMAAATTHAQDALSPADQLMEQCVTQLEACESQAKLLAEQVNDLQQFRAVCEAENESLKSGELAELEKAFGACKELAELRGQRIENLVEIESTISGDREACYERLGETMQNYRTCVQEATKPWWQSSMFFLGILLGLAIGVPVG